MLRERLYPCKDCSWKFPASPPDDVHVIAMVDQCECKSAVPRTFECPNCNNLNTMYWHKPTLHEKERHVVEIRTTERRIIQKQEVIPTGLLLTEEMKGTVEPIMPLFSKGFFKRLD